LNRFTNNSWRISQTTQRVASQRLPYAPRFTDRSLAPAVIAIRQSVALLPSSVILAMILLATSAICWTVITRSRSEFESSYAQYGRMLSDIEKTRHFNAILRTDIRKIETEPAMIEAAARAKLGMVRPNDIVVPTRDKSQIDLATLSIVR